MTPDNPTPAAAPRPSGRPGRALPIAVGFVVLAVLAAVIYWIYFLPEAEAPPNAAPAEASFPPDPRLSYAGPFRNVRPGMGYVGDGRCADCHGEIAETYRRHPMGRSTVPKAQFAGHLPTDQAHNNPFEAFGIQFRVAREDGREFHRQSKLDSDGKPIYDFAHEVDYVVGSGSRGHSYLTVRDGFVFQTPISWFSQKQVWDLSPGFPPWARTGRLIQGSCLYCHADRVEPVEGTRNRYHEPVLAGHTAIGCERCHGPGELHSRTLARDDIVDPKRLEPALREAVCQQCHLEGANRVLRRGRRSNDFRPGMPLTDFWTVYVRRSTEEGNKAVSHVEQMYESTCFQKSPTDRKMGCITCHDPHEAVAPDRRVTYYRGRCLQCHTAPATECRVPVATRRMTNADDSCIACHMPRSATSDIAHTASTDHRILRRTGTESAPRPGPRAPIDLPLLDFFRGAPDVEDTGLGRDLGVALYKLALRGVPLSGRDGETAVALLGRALAECPADLDAWEAKGKVLQTLRRPAEAVAAFEALLQRAPEHETALVTLGTIHRDEGQPDAALVYWRRAVDVNPWAADYRMELVTELAARGAWEEVRPHAQRWLELDPASVEARCAWVQYLIRTGRTADAVAEYGKVRALRPPDLAQRDAWFARLLR